ncbi:Two-pore potassium channel 1 [Citrus sinensis]|uniref:Two-pore potassium channel 1 n=2 Tax=Citrus TaxID=2706 RepID=A0ACB8P1K6_CITSI|nr:two-pore potassium channel 1 [Citrus x clementina]KAH9804195.1 Two-pore potassium channel 1 [Citrus sinensis]
MACNDANLEPLLSGLADEQLASALVGSTNQTNNKDASNGRRRRLHRSTSAPAAPLQNSIPPPDSNSAIRCPNTRKAVVFLAIYRDIGTICFYAVKSQIKGMKNDGILDGIIDSFYFCVVTMTAIGHGDFMPNSVLSKLLVLCAFVFTGMALFALLVLTKAVDYLFNKHAVLIVKALHTYEIADLNGILNEIETSKVRYKCIKILISLPLLILVSTVFQVTIDKMDVVDAIYCSCATITTLGCGDMSFSKSEGLIFAVYWILISCISLTLLFLYVAELNIERRLSSVVKRVLAYKTRHEDLETCVADV